MRDDSIERPTVVEADSGREIFTGFPPSGRMLCPMCNYPLDGLPAEYTCPECGFTYDKETMVWEIQDSRRRRALLIILSFASCAFLGYELFRSFDSTNPSIFHTASKFLTGFLIVFILHAMYGNRRNKGNKDVVAVTPAGILFKSKDGRRNQMPWVDIEYVEFLEHRYFGHLRIHRKGIFSEWSIDARFVPVYERKMFAEAVNRRLATTQLARSSEH
jgi:hypothetical protein